MLVSSNTKCHSGCIWIWPLMHLNDLRGRHPSFAPLCILTRNKFCENYLYLPLGKSSILWIFQLQQLPLWDVHQTVILTNVATQKYLWMLQFVFMNLFLPIMNEETCRTRIRTLGQHYNVVVFMAAQSSKNWYTKNSPQKFLHGPASQKKFVHSFAAFHQWPILPEVV